MTLPQVSVLAMTSAPEGSRETLKHRLLGTRDEVAKWGHEYIRHLAGGCRGGGKAGWLLVVCSWESGGWLGG